MKIDTPDADRTSADPQCGQQQHGQVSRLLRQAEVLLLTGLTKSSLYRAIERGHFPRPVKLTPGASASSRTSSRFLESEVNAFIAARVAERDAALDAGGVR
ncbi:MAG: AlpA family phage regulatory protein [Lysobacterales bacterium]